MLSKEQKKHSTKTSKEGTVKDRFSNGTVNLLIVTDSLCFGDNGQKQNRNGVGQSGGKKNQRQCHSA